MNNLQQFYENQQSQRGILFDVISHHRNFIAEGSLYIENSPANYAKGSRQIDCGNASDEQGISRRNIP